LFQFLKEFEGKDLCGRCTPCRIGMIVAMDILEKIREGLGSEEDYAFLLFIFEKVEKMALCKKGKEASARCKEVLLHQKEQFLEHVRERRCSLLQCPGCISYKIVEDECTMCGACKKVCEFDAIIGYTYIPYLTDNAPYRIRGKSCIKCGKCLQVCPEGAIKLLTGGVDG
jgi:ferredoxin